MNVADVKDVARRWVSEVAQGLPGFEGAFLHGSINWMSDDDPYPRTSDVDVGVVFGDGAPRAKLGKKLIDGVIVEGAAISHDRLATAEQLLGNFQLAHSLRTNSIIADPTGHLERVQTEVERRFGERRWVLARCADARNNSSRYVGLIDRSAPYYNQAICWLFAEGNLAHVPLIAGLRNPTVRRRYSAVREYLESVGRLDTYETILEMLGCATMSRSSVERHLQHMTDAFDRAASLIRSDLPFGSDISLLARPVAVAGSHELIERGEHREAVFWIAVTYARCMTVLELDAPGAVASEFEPGFRALMRDLGVETLEDKQRRATELESFLPELMALAGELTASYPDSEE